MNVLELVDALLKLTNKENLKPTISDAVKWYALKAIEEVGGSK